MHDEYLLQTIAISFGKVQWQKSVFVLLPLDCIIIFDPSTRACSHGADTYPIAAPNDSSAITPADGWFRILARVHIEGTKIY